MNRSMETSTPAVETVVVRLSMPLRRGTNAKDWANAWGESARAAASSMTANYRSAASGYTPSVTPPPVPPSAKSKNTVL